MGRAAKRNATQGSKHSAACFADTGMDALVWTSCWLCIEEDQCVSKLS
jgi:hypothetical protein